MAFGKCECCEAYKEEIKYLRGLVDRSMAIVAPMTADVPDEPKKKDDNAEQYGEH